jgi:MFS family permease
MATVISFLGFLVAGIVALWLLRSSSSRAVGSILRKPVRSFLVGFLTVIAFPAAVLLLAMTLVGLPLAIVGVLIGGIAFIIGPVPAVTALGNRVLLNRGGLFGAFVAGAALWGIAIWLIPVVGGFVYVVGSIWGIGAWVLGFAAARRGDSTLPELLPASMVASDEIPEDWVPPLAPKPSEPVEEDTALIEDTAVVEEDTQDKSNQEEPDDAVATSEVEAPPEEDPTPETDSWGLPKR